MKQQINLYQPAFREPTSPLSAASMLAIVLGVLVAGSLLYGYGRWQVHGMQARVAELAAQRAIALQRLESVQRALPEREASRLLQREVTELAGQAERKAVLAERLVAYRNQASGGVSRFFAALARSRIEGLWLTRVVVGQGGSLIELRGRSRDPSLVPALVQRLSRETAFSGSRFASLSIERLEPAPSDAVSDSPQPPGVAFVLRTRGAMAEQAGS